MFGASANNSIAERDLIRYQPSSWRFGAGPASAFAQDRGNL